MADCYTVLFEGRIANGQDLPAVKRRLQQLMKKDPDQVEHLFGGQTVVVRRQVDGSTAEQYRRAFASAGALCRVVPAEAGGAGVQAPGIPPASPVSPGPGPKPHFKTVKTGPEGGKMIITNIESVPGKTVKEHFGLVSGSTIRAKHIGRDLMAGLKNLVGGELKGYTELLQESRREAVDRMVEQARQVGANAIINVRFSTSSVAQGAAELYAYGTAVRVQ